MEKDDSSEHPHNIADAYHRISHAERKILYDIHPQNRPQSIADATADELPVNQQRLEIIPRP